MVRLMDIGLERLRNMVLNMAKHSEDLVTMTIDAYRQGKDLGRQASNGQSGFGYCKMKQVNWRLS